jgi:hypothetical protein
VAGPDELQPLVEVARLDRKQRLGNPSGPSRTVTLDRSWLFLQRNNSHRFPSFAHPSPPLGAPGVNIKHEHYGNFIVAYAAPAETDQRATARMNSALVGVGIASRPLQG